MVGSVAHRLSGAPRRPAGYRLEAYATLRSGRSSDTGKPPGFICGFTALYSSKYRKSSRVSARPNASSPSMFLARLPFRICN